MRDTLLAIMTVAFLIWSATFFFGSRGIVDELGMARVTIENTKGELSGLNLRLDKLSLQVSVLAEALRHVQEKAIQQERRIKELER